MTNPERLHLKQRKLAQQLLHLAAEFRQVRHRLYGMTRTTRPDLDGVPGYQRLRREGQELLTCFFEVAAALALPPWSPPVEEPTQAPQGHVKTPAVEELPSEQPPQETH